VRTGDTAQPPSHRLLASGKLSAQQANLPALQEQTTPLHLREQS